MRYTEQCPLDPKCYKPAGHAPPCERWGEHMVPITVPVYPVLMETTVVRCGNCKKQYEVPVDQPFRYHAVQQHKFACPAGDKATVEAQHAQLLAEFAAQQARKTTRPAWWKFWWRFR